MSSCGPKLRARPLALGYSGVLTPRLRHRLALREGLDLERVLVLRVEPRGLRGVAFVDRGEELLSELTGGGGGVVQRDLGGLDRAVAGVEWSWHDSKMSARPLEP